LDLGTAVAPSSGQKKEKPMTFQILTVLGSPHDRKSNTRALVDDFVEELAGAGLPLEHRVISLGRKKVDPCRGCWNCTKGRPCPVSRRDDLEEIKAAMIDCDFLILASPVYTNQVSAQIKALFDRLFTWCHVFPLLGKPALSATTTGNEGQGEVGRFLEKMLATWGTHSFGTIESMGGFTPGFFPWRRHARKRNRKLARRVARTLLSGKSLGTTGMQRKMFRVMKRKMRGVHGFNSLRDGVVEGQPVPSTLRVRLLRLIFRKIGLTDADRDKLGTFLTFELGWWRARGWLWARTFKQLAAMPVPEDFDTRARLLEAPVSAAEDDGAVA
jgi:multimeric flavodoxin WrbA